MREIQTEFLFAITLDPAFEAIAPQSDQAFGLPNFLGGTA
jgi:hypothetical protein